MPQTPESGPDTAVIVLVLTLALPDARVEVRVLGHHATGERLRPEEARSPIDVGELVRDGMVDSSVITRAFPGAHVRHGRCLSAPPRPLPEGDLAHGVVDVPADSPLLPQPPKPAPNTFDRPDMTSPTKRLMEALGRIGCALGLVDPDAHASPGDDLHRLLRVLRDVHTTTGEEARGEGLELGLVMPLEYAHIEDRPATMARVNEEGWPVDWRLEVASGEFDRITNITVLCTNCHTLFDQRRTLPRSVVEAAARAVWATAAAGDALDEFIRASLAMRSKHKPDLVNVALAAALLREHHPGRPPYVISPQARPDERFTVNPDARRHVVVPGWHFHGEGGRRACRPRAEPHALTFNRYGAGTRTTPRPRRRFTVIADLQARPAPWGPNAAAVHRESIAEAHARPPHTARREQGTRRPHPHRRPCRRPPHRGARYAEVSRAAFKGGERARRLHAVPPAGTRLRAVVPGCTTPVGSDPPDCARPSGPNIVDATENS
ncbi:hypothetical protein ACWGR4_29335 [Embleya sp. NPDC055664]